MSTVDHDDEGAEAAAMLAAYRGSIEPPADASAAVWAAIVARTGAAAEAPARPRTGRLTLVTLAIAAVVLLGIAAQLGAEIGRERPATPQKAPYAGEGPSTRRALVGEGPGRADRGAADEAVPSDRSLGSGDGAAPAGAFGEAVAGERAPGAGDGAGLHGPVSQDRRSGAGAGLGEPVSQDRTPGASAGLGEPVSPDRTPGVGAGLGEPVSPDRTSGAGAEGVGARSGEPVSPDRSQGTGPSDAAGPATRSPAAAGAGRSPRGGDEAGATDLAAEMALIAEADAALRRGAAGEALRILERHARTFPKGQLAPEREASRVSALCALDRGDEAASAADRFLERWPASHLARRVRESCAAPEGPAEGG